jgi:hypothetical protein
MKLVTILVGNVVFQHVFIKYTSNMTISHVVRSYVSAYHHRYHQICNHITKKTPFVHHIQTKKNSITTSKNPSPKHKTTKTQNSCAKKITKHKKNLQKHKHYALKSQINKSDSRSQNLG